MVETIEKLVRAAVEEAQRAGELPEFEVADLGLERPADSSHGDWTSTVALRSAKLAHKAPATSPLPSPSTCPRPPRSTTLRSQVPAS